ncbi:hypothetical protein AQUCO_00700733v1 [Aquilegia coerulea]|uniref:Transcription factor MYC/MYB N-terminal domain-containing protein n=1 Tax=Aquilegia coerulea TaxID=218851 RepID=A0A2G5ELH6_AQUCA|nr:hypothetical protein AQUCO_00700733v1 [Aquilegia coerulea]
MDTGLPMLSCLLQHTLRSLCSSCLDSPKWVYAVFWRILPRNYPPPKWDYGGGVLDRSKGNKRNWILVWEDGFCDFYECERAGSGYIKGRFGGDVFFKMSHEVYNFGEGLVGKVAAENSHKWVFKENTPEKDPSVFSSWNGSIEPQPKAWDMQFNSGIQTIAIISVREGLIQLGSLEKIVEDLNLVINIQRKFSYLHSIPGVFSMQRSFLPDQYPNTLKSNTNETAFLIEEKRNIMGGKRCYGERQDDLPSKSINLGYNTPQTFISNAGGGGLPCWSIPPLLPTTMSCSLGALLSKLPSVMPSNYSIDAPDSTLDMNNDSTCRRSKLEEDKSDQISHVKPESCLEENSEEEKPQTQNLNSSLEH